MKRRMIASAARPVILADSSKFRHPSSCEVCAADEVRTVVTDSGIAPEERDRFLESDIELIIVDV